MSSLPPPSAPRHPWLPSITTIERIWTVLSVLAIATQLLRVQGFSFGGIMIFLIPTLSALVFAAAAPLRGEQLIAKWFLSCLSVGLVVAEFPRLVPDFGGVDKTLPPASERALAWYFSVYLIFFVGVLPVYLFGRALSNHRQGRPTQFTRFTCVLGLITAAIMLPGMLVLIATEMHFWPLYR